MIIIAKILAVMHSIIILICFYDLMESIVKNIYKKVFKKDLRKKSALDEYDFEFEDDELVPDPPVLLTKDSLREMNDYEDVHIMVREKIFPMVSKGFTGVTDEEKEAVEYLLASLIDYLRVEALYMEQTFPVLHYIIDSIVPDAEDETFCPVEALLAEKCDDQKRHPKFYFDYLKSKEISPDFERVVKIALNLTTEIVKALYEDFFMDVEDFDFSFTEDSFRWAKIHDLTKDYRKKR